MKYCLKRVFCAAFLMTLFLSSGISATLSGTVSVNETKDTAAEAKTFALNNARRQILYNVLSQYSEKNALAELVKDASSDELTNLILSTVVSNEHIATNAYSANITMNIDNDAVKKWLNEHEIQNWVPLVESDEKFVASIVVLNGIVDWSEIKRVARELNIDIETQSMTGNQVVAKLPLNSRTKFTAAVRALGWKYADNGGVLQVWK